MCVELQPASKVRRRSKWICAHAGTCGAGHAEEDGRDGAQVLGGVRDGGNAIVDRVPERRPGEEGREDEAAAEACTQGSGAKSGSVPSRSVPKQAWYCVFRQCTGLPRLPAGWVNDNTNWAGVSHLCLAVQDERFRMQ